MANNAKKGAAEPTKRSPALVVDEKPNQTSGTAGAEIMVEGLGMNAATAAAYSKALGELDIGECFDALIAETRRVQRNDMGGLETLLAAQAVTLNAMFTQLAYQSSKMTIVDQIDRFTRLALKAQGQCRATVETLAAIKNPPMVFARQANIAQGPQQVNNTVSLAAGEAQPLARAGTLESEQNKQLEAHDERLDPGAARAASGRDRALATVGALHRPTND